jgi:hypothetical protein
MSLGHEKLDVYRRSIGYVAWVYGKVAALEGIHRAARDQWLCASQSIPLNIAEGNGKTADADRMAAMLSRLGGRGYQVREEATVYDGNPIDPDPDSDLDETSQTSDANASHLTTERSNRLTA